jgi:uncharacterized repeat protein (TIGR01451 family)
MFMKPLSRKFGNQRLSFEALEDRSVPALVAGLPSDTSETTSGDTKEETPVDPEVIYMTGIGDGEVLETTSEEDDTPVEETPETPATPVEVDLALTETADTATPSVGQTVTFTVTLQNNSTNAASTVTAKDLIPDGMSFVSAKTTTGTYDSSSDIWTVGDVATGTPITMTLKAKVMEAGSLATTASVEAAGHTDTDATNNTADVAIATNLAKLTVTQKVSSSQVGLGGLTTIVVKVQNTGEGAASSLKVTDTMLSGLSILKGTPNVGSFNATTKTWTISNLAAGATAKLELTVRVSKVGEFTNTVDVSGTGINADESTLSSMATVTGKYLTSTQRWVFSPRGGWSSIPTPAPTTPAPAPTTPTIIAPAPYTSAGGILYGRPLASLTNKIPLVKGFMLPKPPVVTEPTTQEESTDTSTT